MSCGAFSFKILLSSAIHSEMSNNLAFTYLQETENVFFIFILKYEMLKSKNGDSQAGQRSQNYSTGYGLKVLLSGKNMNIMSCESMSFKMLFYRPISVRNDIIYLAIFNFSRRDRKYRFILQKQGVTLHQSE